MKRQFLLRATRDDGRIIEHNFDSENDRTAILDASLLMLAMLHPVYGNMKNGKFEIINDLGVILEELDARNAG